MGKRPNQILWDSVHVPRFNVPTPYQRGIHHGCEGLASSHTLLPAKLTVSYKTLIDHILYALGEAALPSKWAPWSLVLGALISPFKANAFHRCSLK